MGFPCVSLKFPKCLTIALLVSCFRFMFLPILNYLGLLQQDQQQQQQQQPECPQENYVLVMDGLSLITVPVQTLTSLIKKRLQVVEFGDFLQRSGGAQDCGEDMVCSVCLDSLDRTHLIRELCNCSHVFHQHCLDCWVDEGQVTCPLCRSMLFPEKSFTETADPLLIIDTHISIVSSKPSTIGPLLIIDKLIGINVTNEESFLLRVPSIFTTLHQ